MTSSGEEAVLQTASLCESLPLPNNPIRETEETSLIN